MENTEWYAQQHAKYDVMEALLLLTKAYISQCGVSMGNRSLVYYAAEVWQEKLAWMDLPLSDMARKCTFVELMPHITSEYVPERYERYDISGLDEEELVEYLVECVKLREFDKATLDVIYWGISKYVNRELFEPYPISVTASDGTVLEGEVRSQSIGWTSIEMSCPYNVSAKKQELVRKPEELLILAYEEYKSLKTKEKEIRDLYPKYQERLKLCGTSRYKLSTTFEEVYKDILGDDFVLFDHEHLFTEWFGLEFYDSYINKPPTWMKEESV